MPPESDPDLLVFIGGRWRGIPQGCSFAVARRGKFVELRPGPVRAALRRFQKRLSSKAVLGPRLSFKKIPPIDRDSSEQDITVSEPKLIHQKNNDVRPSKRKRESTSPDEPIRSITTVATIHASKPEPKQAKNSTNPQLHTKSLVVSSEDSASSAKQTASKQEQSEGVSVVKSPKKNLSLKRKRLRESSSKENSPILKSIDFTEKQITRYLEFKPRKHHKSPKKQENAAITAESDFEEEKIKSKKKPSAHKMGPRKAKINNSSKVSSPVKSSKNKATIDRSQTPVQPKAYKELEIDEQDIQILRGFLQKHYSDSELLRFDSDDQYKMMHFFRINPLVNIEWCPQIARMLRGSQDSQITLEDFASKLGLRSISEASSIKAKRYKIRKTPEKSYAEADSSDSSSDDENVRTPRRESRKILREKDVNNKEKNTKIHNKKELSRKKEEDSLEERSLKEGSIIKHNKKELITKHIERDENTSDSESEGSNIKSRYAKEQMKTDKNNSRDTKDVAKESNKKRPQDTTDSEDSNKSRNAKESTKTDKNYSRDTKDVAKESNKKRLHNKIDTKDKTVEKKQKETDNVNDTVELSSASERDVVKTFKANNKLKLKPVVATKVRKRAHLEYSGLEDQAIVAWVSTGSRASRVNGNLLWRQLQDQYTQITGCRRTWHSLRNRYLRYILPKLGALALPVSQQMRLRAAAATGELKARKKRSPRRNSIFELPPRGAASRRPAPLLDLTRDEEEPRRSPRYSSLTRNFARRQSRPRSERSDGSLEIVKPSDRAEVKDGEKQSTESKGISPRKSNGLVTKTKSTSREKNNNKHSESDKSSKSDKSSESDRSSESGSSSDSNSSDSDESDRLKAYESSRTRRSVHGSNKRISRSDNKKSNDSKRRSTRHSKTRDASNESKRSKSERDKATESVDRSPSRKITRRKSVPRSRDSSESMSRVRHDSPENRRESVKSRRQSKTREKSSESKRRKSPSETKRSMSRSPRRGFNRNTSLSKQSSRNSSGSMNHVRPKSYKPRSSRSITHSPMLKNNRHESSEKSSGDSSNESMSQMPRRKSNRIITPKIKKRKSNRLSSSKQNDRQPRDSSNESLRRKAIRHAPNESSKIRGQKRKSNKLENDSLNEIVVSDTESNQYKWKIVKDRKKKKVGRLRLRKLFNPNAIL